MINLPAGLWRLLINFFPCYFFTGARLSKISKDFCHVEVSLPLTWRTKNIVGTIFGGSMYAAVDPIYMTMLLKILGPNYVVWDKAATIAFKKPGREKLFAHFDLEPQELSEIKTLCDAEPSVDRIYQVKFVNKAGIVHAEFQKTVFIARRDKWNARAKVN